MPEIELDLLRHNPLKLHYALLVYEGDGETAITKNEIDTEGKIGIGKPIDVTSLIDEFNRNQKPVKDGSSWLDDKNKIGEVTWTSPNMLCENSHYRIWFTPPGQRKLFIAGKPQVCWLPLLIWVGHRRRRHLFMMSAAGSRRPTPKTLVYRPKFGPIDGTNHIHKNSEVCLGTMNPGICTPKAWMDAFYDTNFKTADGLPSKPYEIAKAHIKLGSLEHALSKLSSDRLAAE